MINLHIEHLQTHTINDPSKLFADLSCYSSLLKVGKMVAFFTADVNFNKLSLNKLNLVIAGGLKYLFVKRNELNFNTRISSFNANLASLLNDKRVLGLGYLLYLTTKLIVCSDEFCEQFVLGDGLKTHVLFISDKVFIQKHEHAKLNNLIGDYGLFNHLTLNMLNASIKASYEHHEMWAQLNAANILLNVNKLSKSTMMMSYLAIVNIFSRNQFKDFIECNSIIKMFVKFLRQCTNDFKLNRFNRIIFQLDFEKRSIYCAAHWVLCEENLFVSVTTLLKGVLIICALDECSLHVYYDLKNYLGEFLLKGNLK